MFKKRSGNVTFASKTGCRKEGQECLAWKKFMSRMMQIWDVGLGTQIFSVPISLLSEGDWEN